VEGGEAGGGARGGGRAAARGDALHRRQGKQSRATRARGRRREGGGPKDLCAKLNDSRDLSVK
jgi:hypothetical protein